MPILSISGKPRRLGVNSGRLNNCPASPNCVCSDDDGAHMVEPMRLVASAAEAWPLVQDAVRKLPRTSIVTHSGTYLHAECTSALLGFVDDLELHLRADQGLIAVRSASRVGHSDFGVNRKRVEALRATLIARKVIG